MRFAHEHGVAAARDVRGGDRLVQALRYLWKANRKMDDDENPLAGDRERSRSAASGLLPMGLLLLAGGPMALFGVVDDLYLFGLIPVRWVLMVGMLMGMAIVADVVAARGGNASALALAGWFKRYKRLWLGLGLAALAIAAIGTWEEYLAPQEIVIEGAPAASTHVRVTGADGFEQTIGPAARLELAVPNGENIITLTCEGRKAEHKVHHAGFRGKPRILRAP